MTEQGEGFERMSEQEKCGEYVDWCYDDRHRGDLVCEDCAIPREEDDE